MTSPITAIVRKFSVTDYIAAWNAMRNFNKHRSANTLDEIWLLQHPPVYTTGFRFPSAHPTLPNGIPLIHTDRGGDITYHGPGQLIAYVMMDLRRRSWGVKQLVTALEQVVIDLLSEYDVTAQRRSGAPGVHVLEKKIAALGLRVRNGCSYHGIAVNVDMDLKPFTHISICGYPELEVTQLVDEGRMPGLARTTDTLITQLQRNLEYNSLSEEPAESAMIMQD